LLSEIYLFILYFNINKLYFIMCLFYLINTIFGLILYFIFNI
jgi:hypothetical protein